MANYEVLEPGGHAALVDGLKDYADRAGGTDAEQLADGSVGMDKLGDDVIDELDSKAYADGYYAQLTAGAADNLTARGDATTAEFLYRTAGGTADIETGQAVAKSVKGNTLVWNQLVTFSAGTEINRGVTFVRGSDGKVVANGTASDSGVFSYLLLANCPTIAGHKYLLRGCPSGGSESTYYVRDGYNSLTSKYDTGSGAIIEPTSNHDSIYVQLNVVYGTTATNLTFYPQLFDLTQMFGAGNEPSTVAEFEALYPLPYYEYDAGSLLSVNMEGIETVGFNQWDEEWENKGIDPSNGAIITDNTKIVSKNLISVFPSTTYYCKSPNVATYAFWYDANGDYLGFLTTSIQNTTFQTPADCRYMRVRVGDATHQQTTYNHDICINLSWSGRRNGEYEAFWKSQRLIDVATYFPDGMRSAGSIYDELTSIEAITRVGAVDLGTLTWTYASTNKTSTDDIYRMRTSTVLNGAKAPSANSVIGDIETVPYGAISASVSYIANEYGISIDTSGYIYVNDPNYTASDSPAAFKTAMSGVYLFYELATPTVTPIDPALNLSYRVDDFGTERIMVPEDGMSAPPTLEIAYGLNAVDFIRRAPTQYISHDSHDNFVDALEAEMGVTITETFDDTDNAYEYSIAPTDGMTLAQAKENLRGLLDLVQGTIGSVTDWSEIAEMASHGSSFLVGTQFQTTYKSAADGTEYEMPWDVMHFETATVKGGSSVAGVYLESHYALPFATMFDQVEAFYAVPSGGLAAGTYSITFGNTSAWGQVPANSTYNFTLANSYSQGAQLCFNRSIYSYAPDTCTVQAFATQGATTVSETVTVSAGSAGTSLGIIGTAQVTDSSDLNHLHRIGLGSGRWMTSALRQWLNTDADGGTWWVPQTKWDRPPSYASYDGFLKGLDPDLVSAMREVRVVTAQSYSADGGTAAAPVTDVTYDKVFLPSWEQQYLAVSQNYGGTAGLEGSAWDYWKLAAGTANPRPASTSGNESTYTTAYVRYGMENHATARTSWLCSAYRYSGSSAAVVTSSGICGGDGAYGGNFAAPACFIA